MGDKENAPPLGARGAAAPRLTRAAAKRAAAAAAAAEGPGDAKRRRVALGELPALANNAGLRAPSCPVKPSKPASRPGRHARNVAPEARGPSSAHEAERCASSPPRTADADAESNSVSNPAPRATAYADSCASSSPPRAAAAGAPADPQLCGSYASDIYTYLRSLEVEPQRRSRPDYIEAVQADVTAHMRGILVDWLVEVAEEYKLVADTLYLAISYVDRFLSVNALGRDKLQLLGVASMLIAAKYEEISPPHPEDFCYITDNTYTKEELLKMESDILKLLKFELGNPTIKTFLRRFTRSAHEDKKRSILLMEFLGSYLAELSLLDYGCLRFLPSVVAASVMFVARLTIDPNANPWNMKLQKTTGYKVSELKDCIVAIRDLQLNRKFPSLTAIRDKYKQHKFKCVSTLLPPVVVPTSYFEDLAE
ncbi:Cyclin-A3-2 [Zea mays]|uniref:Cyclin-A2 n=2 Tax=Zea mays TaxID=4577 RepID=B6SKE9_MAIZE|nr:cyclin-A2 isoform 1 [Zea mays]ACG25332.1 cyclin-A2 [Zea mays]ONM01605.1 Cyclin-A2 [Zea mays]PWZ52920.1 Cyclin-A3-2 [Zea mays]|eukprot:NP_001147065.1 cyclin-A2 [Zea mays]